VEVLGQAVQRGAFLLERRDGDAGGLARVEVVGERVGRERLQRNVVDVDAQAVGEEGHDAIAESFVDSFKTELIADRVWRTRTQLELAIVEYVAWFNNSRLHSALDDIPPAEFEALYAAQNRALIMTEEPVLETN
jgi:putative transposase